MNKYKITIATWKKLASLYQEKFMNLTLYDESYDLFLNLIKRRTPSILEIGCGPGNITKYLLKKIPNANILATDVATEMLVLAKKNNPSIRVKQLDARAIHTLEATFDGIVVGFCTPYLDKEAVNNLLNSCYSKLLEEGVLYLSTIEGDYNDSGFKEGSTGDQAYVYYYSKDQLKKMFLAANFELVSEITIPYPNNNFTENHLIYLLKKS